MSSSSSLFTSICLEAFFFAVAFGIDDLVFEDFVGSRQLLVDFAGFLDETGEAISSMMCPAAALYSFSVQLTKSWRDLINRARLSPALLTLATRSGSKSGSVIDCFRRLVSAALKAVASKLRIAMKKSGFARDFLHALKSLLPIPVTS